jgi:hypothetical protein
MDARHSRVAESDCSPCSRKLWLVGAVGILWCVCDLHIVAQRQQQVFMSLAAPDGTSVTDLKAEDIGITEDGVSCKIVKFEPIDWPTHLQVLIDNGKAVTNPDTGLREGLNGLFELMPSGVVMSMYLTTGAPRAIVKPTTTKQTLIDGIGLIGSDNGVGAFFEAVFEAAKRAEQDKTPGFPVILMIGSDMGRIAVPDGDHKKLQQIIQRRAITVHIVVLSSGSWTTGGALQTEVGSGLSKLSGGRYEKLATTNRLATLLPELGKRIANNHVRQSHQFRITYERPANAAEQPRIGASVRAKGTPLLSLDGRLP